MAWPKLRVIRSGAAHDGARSQDGVREGAQAGSVGQARPVGQARSAEPVSDAAIAWPGQSGEAEADLTAAGADVAPAEADVVSAGVDEVSAGAETSEDEPFWDLSHPEDPADDPNSLEPWLERLREQYPPSTPLDDL